MTSAILTRRMIRRYTDQPIPRAVLDDLLAAATRAPSPHNRQPWRFAMITGDARAHLAQTMGDQLRAGLAADGLPAEVIEKDAARSAQRITSAQAGILICLSMADMDVYPDACRNAAEHWMAGASRCRRRAKHFVARGRVRFRRMLDVRAVVLPKRSYNRAAFAR